MSATSLLTYAVIFSPAALVAYGYPNKKTTFFWHPVFMASALSAFVTGRRLIRNDKRDGRINLHALANIVGCSATWIAAKVIYDVKNQYKKQHITTWHARIGLAGLSLMTLQTVFGLVGVYVKPVAKKDRHETFSTHRTVGKVVNAVFAVAAFTGIKQSFAKDMPMMVTGQLATVAAVVVGAVC